MTQDYYGTKRITAWEQEQNSKPGYGVKYRDGYTSWSPKNEFEAAYQPLDALSFGHAIVALKTGLRVARAGWDGKGMFLFLIHGARLLEAWTYTDGKQDNFPLLPFIAMKTAANEVVPWLASQTDMLADDWQIVE